MIAITGTLFAVGCGPERPHAGTASAAVARAADDEPMPAWLDLGGARMLVTTTRAARGRTEGLPVLIMLPWSRSTPAEALAEVGYVDIDVPAYIVAIQGFERDGDAFSWWRRTRPAPDDPDRDDELVALLTDRAQRLAALVALVQHHLGSASPPVVSGISQGGDLSIALGVLHPSTITAAIPIAARFPRALWPSTDAPSSSPPIDAFQGAADPIAPAAALQRAIAALRDRGHPAVLHLYNGVSHEVSTAQRADLRACVALRLRSHRQPCPEGAARSIR